jgi:uridine kinase
MDTKSKKTLVIGVCGGTSSGKTTLAKKIWQNVVEWGHNAMILSQDSFYRNLTQAQLEQASKNEYNFDQPTAIDFESMRDVVKRLIDKQEEVKVPIYDFLTHQRSKEHKCVRPTDILIIEGIFIFSDAELRKFFDIMLFVDVDADTRLLRRIRRDLKDRGRDISQVLESYEKFVKPGFMTFIEPYKRYAHLIIPGGGENEIAYNVISQYLSHYFT